MVKYCCFSRYQPHAQFIPFFYLKFFISFFDSLIGFPLDKAVSYAKLRNPLLINDLNMQYYIQDRYDGNTSSCYYKIVNSYKANQIRHYHSCNASKYVLQPQMQENLM